MQRCASRPLPIQMYASLQAAALLILSEPALAAWGIPASSPLRADALTYLHVKALGAPALVMLFVTQVRPST